MGLVQIIVFRCHHPVLWLPKHAGWSRAFHLGLQTQRALPLSTTQQPRERLPESCDQLQWALGAGVGQ